MELKGLTRELAGNCVIKSKTETSFELALAPSQEHLLNQSHADRIEKALQTWFSQDMKLSIVLEDSENETPAEANARLDRERQRAAQHSVNNDPTVQSLLDTFNGTIDQDSIQPQ